MKKVGSDIKLLLVMVITLTGTLIAIHYNKRTPALSYSGTMKKAAGQAQEWFNIIEKKKNEMGVISDAGSAIPNSFMIGDEWSDITTTLGSLEAKETSSNPDFAALTVRWLYEAGIKKDDKIGVMLSGSFPAIAISVLAALQTIGTEAVIISSLGASTYGANQPEATWLDMEGWLAEYGGLKFRSRLVSMGAGQDRGNGLPEEGKILLTEAAERNHIELYKPSAIEESIFTKTGIFLDNNISMLINLGGNMSSMGACVHALSIPNGLNISMTSCTDSDRGVIARINEKGIPFIQFLNIKEIASRYGIDIAPGNHFAESTNLYTGDKKGKTLPIIVLIASMVPVIFLKKQF